MTAPAGPPRTRPTGRGVVPAAASPHASALRRPRAVDDAVRSPRAMERASVLSRMDFVVEELTARYPDLGRAVVRAETLEVLCLGTPDRLTPTLVARLVEARLLALL